jgi:hypothetical protein
MSTRPSNVDPTVVRGTMAGLVTSPRLQACEAARGCLGAHDESFGGIGLKDETRR